MCAPVFAAMLITVLFPGAASGWPDDAVGAALAGKDGVTAVARVGLVVDAAIPEDWGSDPATGCSAPAAGCSEPWGRFMDCGAPIVFDLTSNP